MSEYKVLHAGDVEILQTNNEIIITGSPCGKLYDGHNCDEMGCSSVSHVLLRMPINNNILGLSNKESKK
jgi:hypothetical protein